MTKYKVFEDSSLKNSYIPLQTAEEEYSIVSLRDFFTKIIDLLIEYDPDRELATEFQKIEILENEEQAVDIAIQTMEDFSKKHKKKILLLLDNFDLILDEKIMDKAQAGKLRDVLMNRSFLTLIAAAPTHFREVSGYDRPFYQFFNTIELEEFSFEKINELLKKQAELENNEQMLENFDELKPRIQAVHHITGGNPRLALMLYQLYNRSELPEVRSAITKLLDDLTPYYKHRMEDLPIQQRKVLDTFARLGRPVTPTELAKETRLKVNQINSILNRLSTLGFVSKAPQKKRKTTYYMVSERVFRIWHQMRFSPINRRRIEFFIEFLRIWYSEKEWLEESNRLLTNYTQNSEANKLKEAGRFIDHLEYMVEAAPKPEMGFLIMDVAISTCIEKKDYEQAKRLLYEQIKRYEAEGDKDRLAELFYNLSYLLDSQGNKPKEIIEGLEKALEFNPDYYEALVALGGVLAEYADKKKGKEKENLLREAIDKYQRAKNIKSDDYIIPYGLGLMYLKLGKDKRGKTKEKLIRAAINNFEISEKIMTDDHDVITDLGIAFGMLSQEQQNDEKVKLLLLAIEQFKKASNIDSSNPRSYANWGNSLALLSELKDDEEKENLLKQATDKYDKSNNLSDDIFLLYTNKGNAFLKLASLSKEIEKEAYFEHAVKNFQKATEIAAENEVDNLDLFFTNYVRASLYYCLYEINTQNYGHAREIFLLALDKSPKAEKNIIEKLYLTFFISVLDKKVVDICEDFFTLMEKQNMTPITELLEPVKSTITYWKTEEKDQEEFLDRINPEIREIVEKLIKKKNDRE
jgi:tetratricopeptide (TPR) repeat protein